MTDFLAVGTHLVTPRTAYVHHGLYAGCGLVIHYAGLCDGIRSGPIEEISLDQFSSGRGFSIVASEDARYRGADAIHRARSRLGEDDYNVLTNNCEHFVHWCLYDRHHSEQVKRAVKAAGSMIASRYGSSILGAAVTPAGLTLATGLAVGYGVHRYLKAQGKKMPAGMQTPMTLPTPDSINSPAEPSDTLDEPDPASRYTIRET